MEGAQDFSAEFSQLKIENDLVYTLFNEINRLSDAFAFNFVEMLKQDLDSLIPSLFFSVTETVTFYTYMLILLRRLQPVDGAFTNTLVFCKMIADRITNEEGSPLEDFNKFFRRHLFRQMCNLIKECPNKRQQICELIFAHCAHDLQLRIKVV